MLKGLYSFRPDLEEVSVRYKFTIFAAAICCLSVSAPLSAHHGNAAYASGKRITMKGTVTGWIWSNPHCLLKFDVKGDNGDVVHWVAETQAPSLMIATGWRPLSFKPGDEITITLEPMKDDRPAGRVQDVTLPNGTTLHGQTNFKEDQYAPKN
jgi:hypothetical protein